MAGAPNTKRLVPDKADAVNRSLNWSHIIFRLTEHCSGLLVQDKEGWDLQLTATRIGGTIWVTPQIVGTKQSLLGQLDSSRWLKETLVK